jgi:NAD(P)-dependent dehydrogenase (short-subunit alcohol dehydrogenase family)
MRVIVVGASGTIGKSLADHLAKKHEVVRASSRKSDVLVDITDAGSIRAMFETIGPFDALISAAGSGEFARVSEITEAQFYTGIKSKMMGQINLALIGQHYINDKGSFTLTSGILAEDPVAGGVSLSVVNSAINAFTMAAALELERGLRINAVSPGIVADSVASIGEFFPGHYPVPMDRVISGYVKSAEGILTGQVIKVYS